MSSNPFGDLDDEFAKTDAKAPAAEKLIVPGTYCFAIVPFDAKGNGQMVEYDTFKAGETTGIRMMLEILSPETMKDEKTGEDVKTAGEQVEKVFWATVKNMPYLKNDLSEILQREIPEGEKLSKTMESTWAGRTFQASLMNEEDNRRRIRNSISFITRWSPEEPAKEAGKKEEPKKETAAAGKPATKQTKF